MKCIRVNNCHIHTEAKFGCLFFLIVKLVNRCIPNVECIHRQKHSLAELCLFYTFNFSTNHIINASSDLRLPAVCKILRYQVSDCHICITFQRAVLSVPHWKMKPYPAGPDRQRMERVSKENGLARQWKSGYSLF